MKNFMSFLMLSGVLMGSIATLCATEASLSLKSSAFADQKNIPTTYTCEGENRSPPLSWSGEPQDVISYVIIASDQDAPREFAPDGRFIHWLIYNIPGTAKQLSEGQVRDQKLADGTGQGMNSFHRLGYDGPCPPTGKDHRYTFTLYALDTMLDIKPSSSYEDLQKSMYGHILGRGELHGTFKGSDADKIHATAPNPPIHTKKDSSQDPAAPSVNQYPN